eukprot:scaffold123342_cov18-Prasinocladus_malaysianus.AAC.1
MGWASNSDTQSCRKKAFALTYIAECCEHDSVCKRSYGYKTYRLASIIICDGTSADGCCHVDLNAVVLMPAKIYNNGCTH